MLFRPATLLSLALPFVSVTTAVEVQSSSGMKRHNEYVVLEGHTQREKYHSPLPHTYIKEDDLPVSPDRTFGKNVTAEETIG